MGQYLTDEYRELLAGLVEDDPDVSRRDIERRYVQKCEEMRGFMKEGTPASVIRRLSFSTVESDL